MSNDPVYTLEDGAILRHGEPVGRYDTNTGEITELDEGLAPQIPSILKRMIADEIAGGTQSDDTLQEEEKAPESKEKEQQPHASEIPPEPEQDPRYGDKTPAYAEWLFKFYPEKAAKVYAGRKIMGKWMPPVISAGAAVPEAGNVKIPEVGADVPEDAMAKEAPEQWMHK